MEGRKGGVKETDQEVECRPLVELAPHERYTLSNYDKVKKFKYLSLSHPLLINVMDSMTHYLCPHNGVPIIVLAGVSGVGKSWLLEEILPGVVAQKDYRKPGGIIYVEAPAIGEQRMMLKAFYTLILRAGYEPLIDKKVGMIVKSGRLLLERNSRGPTARVLFESIKSMFQCRQHLALAIDEVLHLLRFHEMEPMMDMLKSLARDDCPKLIVVGDFNVTERARSYEQYVRRGRTIFFPRYDHAMAELKLAGERKHRQDMVLAQYLSILSKIKAHWPWPDCMDVDHYCPELLWHSLGNMGLLKQIMASCLVKQNDNGGEWDNGFLKRSYLPALQRASLVAAFEKNETEMAKFDCLGEPAEFPTQ
ncbi:AAA family ATPase [Cupriavidus sp. amp6]|uniref:AAA family ATPase n=1 Tax=Cupriavidus sp. amp6 TaxID=388051 RepID=UPI00040F4F35|nr:AAA family ATPase [Cupriavidus sp. amp6]